MLLHEVTLSNVLSFGSETTLGMKPLNVLIGPNGSGKSNFIEALGLLHAAPTDIRVPIREGGGVVDWLWRGDRRPSSARLEVVVDNPRGQQPLRYSIEFGASNGRFELLAEKLENQHPYPDQNKPYFYLTSKGGRATLNYRDPDNRQQHQQLRPEDVDFDQSILAQRKDPDHYPEITYLGRQLGKIRLYREWTFGRNTALGQPQKPDLPNDFLLEDGSNLGLILSRLALDVETKQAVLEALHQLYDGISDFRVSVENNAVQLFLQERNITVPATRLSDGTLRYLCLLTVLCDPEPPPLVCLEEPELGLHPDVLPQLADLLDDASRRCQLVVTTHSDTLVDALTEDVGVVVVCEKHDGKTTMRRLDPAKLSHWLKKYRLGQLWSTGEIGGNRW